MVSQDAPISEGTAKALIAGGILLNMQSLAKQEGWFVMSTPCSYGVWMESVILSAFSIKASL